MDQDWSRYRCRKDGVPSRMSHAGRRFLVKVILFFRTATGELFMSNKQLYVDGCDDWGTNLRVLGVQAPVCETVVVCW